MSRLHIVLIIVNCILLLAVVTYGLYLFNRQPTVVYDGETFTPASITVKRGQTVVFKNKSGEAFWPASDLHPSHSIWNAFDPKEPVAENETWNFTFTKSGTWTYHNHIRPTHTGTITVLDDSNALATANCGEYDSLQCWNEQIETALTQKSLTDVFALVGDLYEREPAFREICHDAVHLIGEEMYAQFSNGQYPHLPETTATCGYGFFHGFMETLFSISGDMEQAREFCAYINESARGNHVAFDACYHGIGHGTVDGSDPRAWGDPLALTAPGLTVCTKVTDNLNHKRQCGNGVFESLADMYLENAFGLQMPTKDPYDLCLHIEEDFKLSCYEQLNPLPARISKENPLSALALVNSIQDERYKNNALRNVAGTLAHPDMTDAEYGAFIEACHALGTQLSPDCIFGFTAKLLEFGSLQSSRITATDFCLHPTLNEDEKKVCFGRIVDFFPLQERKSMCTAISQYIDPQTIIYCSPTMTSDGQQKNT